MSDTMTNFQKFEKSVLYPYIPYTFEGDSEVDGSIEALLQKVAYGSYVEALKEIECQKAMSFNSVEARERETKITDHYRNCLEDYINSGGEKEQKVVFCIGIACLQLFTQNNYCGPLIGPSSCTLLPGLIPYDANEVSTRDDALQEIVIDTEGVYSLLSNPEYLIMARVVFFELKHRLTLCQTADWWCCRYGIVHQRIAEEESPIIYETVVECINRIEKNKNLVNEEVQRDITALFHLEAGHFYLNFYDIAKSKSHFDKALDILAMSVTLTGALGVRTKWQQNELAQLVVKVSYQGRPLPQEEQPGPSLLPSDLPKDIVLGDDTRLNKIKFLDVDEGVIPNLRPLEQMALFGRFLLRRKSQAQGDQLQEETKAFLMALLQFPKNWALQLSGLVVRSRVESVEMRSMERSLNQFEELINSIRREEPSRFERLKLIYASFLLTHWNIQQELARMYVRLGSIKTALELFERLHLWEDVILCYNELQLRHRSAEIIRELLNKKETPLLWCLLGDATDDFECYEKAWKLSGERSGRAQRCMGNYYYVKKEYGNAIEHYELSVQINSLQFTVWQRLAYCALQSEDWEKCASAYHRCSTLEPENFESWNNMSQAYLKLGKLHKAWKSLEEALRCRIDNWRLWDNYMLVSTTLGYMTQALNSYTRILQYKEKHVDTEILGRIVQAIIQEKDDPDGRPMKTLYKRCLELLAKLSREVPTNSELWFLYAELTYRNPEGSKETKHMAMQYFRKSVAADTQKMNWERDTEKSILVLARTLKLIEAAKEVCAASDVKAALSDLSSIRMLVKNVITLIKKSQVECSTGEVAEPVKKPLADVEEELVNINGLLDKFRQS